MSRIDRYVLSQLITLFGVFSLILISIYWVNRAISLFDWLIADGQSAWVFLEVVALSLPYVMQLVLPVSAFAAAVYVTNRLSAESERVVIEAAGIGGFRLLRPYLVFGLIVAVLVGILAHFLVPVSRAELDAKRSEISRDVAARLIVEGKFLNPSAGVTFYIREITAAGELRNVFLHETDATGRTTTYTAERAYIVNDDPAPKLVMFDGLLQTVSDPAQRLSTVSFDDLTYDMDDFLAGDSAPRIGVRELGTHRLVQPSDELLRATGASAADFRLEAHRRMSQTLAPVIYSGIALAALMLGGFSRFGLWRQIALAIGLVIVLWGIGSRAEDLLRAQPEYWGGLYLQFAAGVATIAALLWLARTPALFRRRRAAPDSEVPA